MENKQREEVALFRFGVISDLVGATRLEHGEFSRLVREKSGQRWNIPFSNRTRLSEGTIRRWVNLYEASGRQFTSLYPEHRSDSGKSRKVDEETTLSLVRLKKEKPTLPVARLIAEMEEKNLISPGFTLCLSTAYRILKREGVSGRQSAVKTDRRRFEAEFPNDIWQSDVMHGPHVLVQGKRRKSYLIAFLDDHSRLLPHAQFYLSENLISWLDAFRQALLTRGLPRKLYVDKAPPSAPAISNGSVPSWGSRWFTPRPTPRRAAAKSSVFFARSDPSYCHAFTVNPWTISTLPWISGSARTITSAIIPPPDNHPSIALPGISN